MAILNLLFGICPIAVTKSVIHFFISTSEIIFFRNKIIRNNNFKIYSLY